MTNQEQLIELFRRHGYKMTLGQLLEYPCGYKCTSRFSELRDMGYRITCTKGARPSQNLYEMVPPDPDGQLRIVA